MQQFNPEEHPHRRFNSLTGGWVLVSPHRTKRPWQGQTEKKQGETPVEYDPKCYLCPGNERAGGKVNPTYNDNFVFTNDFSSLLTDTPEGNFAEGEFFKAQSEQGICKVICFSPRHDLTIPEMPINDIKKVVDLWAEEYTTLGQEPFINHVQIFENKGAIMGCSNPHPHGQIWAQKAIPGEPAKEDIQQKEYFQKHGRSLLSDYVQEELKKQERILFENGSFVVLVPYWAIWPYEAMIVSKKHMLNLTQLNDQERTDFAEAYQHLTIKYDNLFEVSFPYSAGIHQSPTNNQNNEHWHLHMHFYPPLLRSATVKKFMVGYEMLANPQRDITAETSAKILNELPDIHYKHG